MIEHTLALAGSAAGFLIERDTGATPPPPVSGHVADRLACTSSGASPDAGAGTGSSGRSDFSGSARLRLLLRTRRRAATALAAVTRT